MTKRYVSCQNKRCGAKFEVEEDNVDKELQYIMCPFCAAVSLSPFYEGKNEKD